MLKLRKNGRDSARRTSEIEPTACAIAGEVRLRAEAVFVGNPSTTVGGSGRKLESIKRPNFRIVKSVSMAHGPEAVLFPPLTVRPSPTARAARNPPRLPLLPR